MHTHTLCEPRAPSPALCPQELPRWGPASLRPRDWQGQQRLSLGQWEGGALGPPLAPALSSVLEFQNLLWACFLRCEVDSPSRPRLSQPPGAGTDEGDRKALLETWKHWEVVGGVLRTPRAPLSPKGLQ